MGAIVGNESWVIHYLAIVFLAHVLTRAGVVVCVFKVS